MKVKDIIGEKNDILTTLFGNPEPVKPSADVVNLAKTRRQRAGNTNDTMLAQDDPELQRAVQAVQAAVHAPVRYIRTSYTPTTPAGNVLGARGAGFYHWFQVKAANSNMGTLPYAVKASPSFKPGVNPAPETPDESPSAPQKATRRFDVIQGGKA